MQSIPLSGDCRRLEFILPEKLCNLEEEEYFFPEDFKQRWLIRVSIIRTYIHIARVWSIAN
jgi:hypothetical protein